MKILAFVDTHEEPDALARLKRIVRQEKIDIACCMGDFTIFGRQTKKMLKQLDTLGVPVVLIHGNHEDEDEILELLPKHKQVHWVHGKFLELQGIRFFGFGGHGFSEREPELEKLEKKHAKRFDGQTIVMSHAPPFGTNLDQVTEDWHVGNDSLTQLIKRRKPLLVFCGHIHQCFHERDIIAGTRCINPGPEGEIVEVELD